MIAKVVDELHYSDHYRKSKQQVESACKGAACHQDSRNTAGRDGAFVTVFTACARAPLAGSFLAVPALAATGLLDTAHTGYGEFGNGLYSLDVMLCEGVFRALLGEARAERTIRIAPTALGRILGLDQAPEVKTIHRKIRALAEAGSAGQWIAAMARRHVDTRPLVTFVRSRTVAKVDSMGFVVRRCTAIGGHLRLQRGRKHLPGTVTDDLVEQRSPAVVVGAVVVVYYRKHGRTFPTSVAALALIEYPFSCRSPSGKVRPSRFDHFSDGPRNRPSQ